MGLVKHERLDIHCEHCGRSDPVESPDILKNGWMRVGDHALCGQCARTVLTLVRTGLDLQAIAGAVSYCGEHGLMFWSGDDYPQFALAPGGGAQ